jgi:hypothetical protein
MADIFYPCETAENQIRSLNNPLNVPDTPYDSLVYLKSNLLLPLPLACCRFHSLTARLPLAYQLPLA